MQSDCPTKPGPCHRLHCRYWISEEETLNCALKITRDYTQDEIGVVMGITKQRVQQIEAMALLKLQQRYPRSLLTRILTPFPVAMVRSNGITITGEEAANVADPLPPPEVDLTL